MKTSYISAIKLSLGLAAIVCQSSAFAEDISVPKASKQYDVVIKDVTCGDQASANVNNLCSGEGVVHILATGTSKVIQSIKPPYLKVFKDTPAFSSALNQKQRSMYAQTYAVVIEDFNFDGRDDVALWTGDESGYGGPSYDVYLLNPKTQQFVHSPALSKLSTEPYLGLFAVKNKRLIASSKSGCCHHETEEYTVVRNKPVLVKKTVEQLDDSQKYITRTVKSKYKGKWVQKTSTLKAK